MRYEIFDIHISLLALCCHQNPMRSKTMPKKLRKVSWISIHILCTMTTTLSQRWYPILRCEKKKEHRIQYILSSREPLEWSRSSTWREIANFQLDSAFKSANSAREEFNESNATSFETRENMTRFPRKKWANLIKFDAFAAITDPSVHAMQIFWSLSLLSLPKMFFFLSKSLKSAPKSNLIWFWTSNAECSAFVKVGKIAVKLNGVYNFIHMVAVNTISDAAHQVEQRIGAANDVIKIDFWNSTIWVTHSTADEL